MFNSGNNWITPEALKKMLDAGEAITVIDVREPAEYKSWHIRGSINIPLNHLTDNIGLYKNSDIITVCAHGMRSERARQILTALGYKARTMAGGMIAWNSVYDITEVPCEKAAVLQLRRIGKGCLSYMIISGKEAAVIDPAIDIDVYIKAADEKKAKIVAVLDTHTHADHVSGARALADETGGIYYSPDSLTKIKHENINEKSKIKIGKINIKTILSPGHTPESVIYFFDALAFTGDTLFVESVGRPDLGQDARENAAVLWETLHKKLLTLENIIILPAHYSEDVEIISAVAAPLEDIKKLHALQMQKHAFVEWVCSSNKPKPPNFQIIKKINQGLERCDEDEIRELEAGPNMCSIR